MKKPGRIRRSLRYSFKEGIFSSGMLGLTENFWVACAEALGVSALKAGLVSTLPQLVSSAAQTGAGRITEALGGRLASVRRLIVLQWLSLVPLTFLPLLPADRRYSLLLVCAIFFIVGGTLPAPAWQSLMSSHLPPRGKGKYFGWRNRTLGFIGLAAGLAGGAVLHSLQRQALWGFSILFGAAFLCRLISWKLMARMIDPRAAQAKSDEAAVDAEADIPDSFLKFVRADHDFVRFCFFVASFTFSVNVTAPYLAVYMLRELRFSYTTFSAVVFSATLAALLGMKVWGQAADRFGNLKVIQATSASIALVPALWSLSSNPVWLVAVQIAAGFAWSGFQLCIMTFAFAEVPTPLRTRAIGYLSALNGMAIFLGSFAGGKLLGVVPALHGSRFLSLLLVSSFLRAASFAYFYRRVKESREVENIGHFDLYAEALGLHPVFQAGKEILEVVLRRRRP